MKADGKDIRYTPEKDGTYDLSAIAHLTRYLFVKNNFDLTDKSVLDFGCGSGYGSCMLSEKALSVDALDYSGEAIHYARNTHKRDNLRFYHLDATNLKSIRKVLTKQYDVIVTFDVIEHVEDYFDYLYNTTRLLKKDGVLIIGSPNRLRHFDRHKGWDIHHVQEFTPLQWDYILKLYYGDINMYTQDFSSKGKKNKIQGRKKALDGLIQILKKIVPTGLRNFGFPIYNKLIYGLKINDVYIRKESDIKVLEQGFGLLAVCKKPNPKIAGPLAN